MSFALRASARSLGYLMGYNYQELLQSDAYYSSYRRRGSHVDFFETQCRRKDRSYHKNTMSELKRSRQDQRCVFCTLFVAYAPHAVVNRT